MAGIPIDNAESYVETLLDAGYRVAVADQVEDPDEVSGLVERAVTRIITPGTLTEDALLRSPDNNYVAALTTDSRRFGLALLDVSTGDFYATSAGDVDAIADEVGRFAPAEAIVGPNVAGAADADDVFGPACMVTPYDEHVFERDLAGERVGSYFGNPDSLLADDVEVRACGALLEYAEYTRGGQSGTADDLPRARPNTVASTTSTTSRGTTRASTCCSTPSRLTAWNCSSAGRSGDTKAAPSWIPSTRPPARWGVDSSTTGSAGRCSTRNASRAPRRRRGTRR